MENKIVLLGAGGHCKSVLDALLRANEYQEIVITDPEISPGEKIMGCTVVGSDDELPRLYEDGFRYAFVTVGSITNCNLRIKLVNLSKGIGFSFPTIIDPSSIVSEFSNVKQGTFIAKNSVVNSGAVIGEHCIINTGAIVEHDCEVGDYCHISVGTILCGRCKIGRESFIGAGSTIIQDRRIGKKAIIGANSTVLTDVEDQMKCYGIINNRGGGVYNLAPLFTSSICDIILEVA